MIGKIIKSISGFYDVLINENVYRLKARGNFRNSKITPLVGDLVVFNNDGYIFKVLPRKNMLIRPHISNIDQIFIVVSAKNPNMSFKLLDKFLVYLSSIDDVTIFIYVTKTDLLSLKEYKEIIKILDKYYLLGYMYFAPRNIFDIDVLKQIKKLISKKVSIFTGQTGVGKSTLLNNLFPGINLKTSPISQSLNRGKHTTRYITLYSKYHGLIGDTPGFSSLSLKDLKFDVSNLMKCFPEFKKFKSQCKFKNCVHINEPNCEIKKKVYEGEILRSRYDNYLNFYNELSQFKFK